MSQLLEFLKTHEEAFRSRSRLASLYSDFRSQRQTNPDGYDANATIWQRALNAAAEAGLLSAQDSIQHDRLVLHSSEELARSLQTPEFGRPLALGAVIDDSVKKKDFIPLKDFVDVDKDVFAKSRLPSAWDVVSWGLRQLGVIGGDTVEDKLVKGDFVIRSNVEAAARAVLDQASRIATSNTSRVFSKELFASTFASSVGSESMSPTDLSVMISHLVRDKSAISYSAATGTIKFKAASETAPSPISEEDHSIASIRTLMSSMAPQVQQLMDQVTELDKEARTAVASKQPTIAKARLRSKRLVDTKLQQRTATLTQLEEVYAKIEQAADQVEMVRVMEASSKTLRSLNKQTGGVDRVQDVVEGLREEMTSVDEIGQAMNEVSAGEIDEGEVDMELEALETAEREKVEERERKEQEKRDEEEAERTRMRLAELDQAKVAGQEQFSDEATNHEGATKVAEKEGLSSV